MLQSGDLATQAQAIDRVAELLRGEVTGEDPQSLLSEIAECLARSPHPFAIASRMEFLGPPMIPTLDPLLEREIRDENKLHVAVLLLHWNSRSGVPFLLSRLDGPGLKDGFLAAAIELSKHGIPEAREPIERIMREVNFRALPSWNVYDWLGLIEARKRYGPLPPDLDSMLRRTLPPLFHQALD